MFAANQSRIMERWQRDEKVTCCPGQVEIPGWAVPGDTPGTERSRRRTPRAPESQPERAQSETPGPAKLCQNADDHTILNPQITCLAKAQPDRPECLPASSVTGPRPPATSRPLTTGPAPLHPAVPVLRPFRHVQVTRPFLAVHPCPAAHPCHRHHDDHLSRRGPATRPCRPSLVAPQESLPRQPVVEQSAVAGPQSEATGRGTGAPAAWAEPPASGEVGASVGSVRDSVTAAGNRPLQQIAARPYSRRPLPARNRPCQGKRTRHPRAGRQPGTVGCRCLRN